MISAFLLKIIALISMTCDHLSYVIFGKFSLLNCIGRIAFPIFAFQISEGYIYTKNLKKYFLRLFIFALISQYPFMLFRSIFTTSFGLNIFFTLLLGLMAIYVFDTFYKLEYKDKYIHYLNIFFGATIVAIIALISNLTHCDYGYYGVLIIFVFYLFKQNKLLMNIAFILCTIIYNLKNILYSLRPDIYILITVCSCLSAVFIDLYNGKKGKDTKYILYLFYPIHLLILYLLGNIL